MLNKIKDAYHLNIEDREINFLDGSSFLYNVTEITTESIELVYEDANIKVKAIRVYHGAMKAFAYKIHTADGAIIVFSGDRVWNATVSDTFAVHTNDADLVIHECYSEAANNSTDGQVNTTVNYFPQYHTSCYLLGYYAQMTFPSYAKLVLTHQMLINPPIGNPTEMVQEVVNGTARYSYPPNGWPGYLVYGHDQLFIQP